MSAKNFSVQGPCLDSITIKRECPVMLQNKLYYTVACTLLGNILWCVHACWAIPSFLPFTLWRTCIVSSWKCYSTVDSSWMKTGQLQGCSDCISSVGNPRQRSSVVWYCSGMPASVPVVTSLLLCPEQFWNGFYLNKLSFLVLMCFEQHGTVPIAINSTNMPGM
jgi:hypothetical protein